MPSQSGHVLWPLAAHIGHYVTKKAAKYCPNEALQCVWNLQRRLLEIAGVTTDYDRLTLAQPTAAARLMKLDADWQPVRMTDNGQPNSVQASIGKAKAGRVGTEISLGCVELAGTLGYSEHSLLEKWARDAKILDIFEGTQQIQLLIIARRLLDKTSADLK